jgi:hypothetical protein
MMRTLTATVVLLCLARSLGHAVPARFTFGIRDGAGTSYELMIYASDERLSATSEDEMYAAYSVGDRKVEGLWQTTLRRSGSSVPVRQDVRLFGDTNRGEFNLERGMVFVMRAGGGQPDVLVVEAYGSSNTNSASLFAISAGKLRHLADLGYSPRPPFRVHTVAPFRLRSSDYDNSVGQWTIYDWTFSLTPWRLTCTRQRRVAYDSPKLGALAR